MTHTETQLVVADGERLLQAYKEASPVMAKFRAEQFDTIIEPIFADTAQAEIVGTSLTVADREGIDGRGVLRLYVSPSSEDQWLALAGNIETDEGAKQLFHSATLPELEPFLESADEAFGNLVATLRPESHTARYREKAETAACEGLKLALAEAGLTHLSVTLAPLGEHDGGALVEVPEMGDAATAALIINDDRWAMEFSDPYDARQVDLESRGLDGLSAGTAIEEIATAIQQWRSGPSEALTPSPSN